MTEAARLSALRSLGLLDTPPAEAFDRLTRLAARTFGVPVALIALVDADRVWFKSRHGIDAAEVPRAGSPCDAIANTGEALIVSDATKDPRFAAYPLSAGGVPVRFYAGHPLAAPDGSVVGTLILIDPSPREFDFEQRRALRDMALMVEEQLAAEAAATAQARARVLAVLRADPENRAARRRVLVLLYGAAAAVVAVTALSLFLTRRLTADSDLVAAALAGPNPAAGAAAPLADLRATAAFFRAAVGFRALAAFAVLAAIFALIDRHLDSQLAVRAEAEVERERRRSAA